jgi:hypothetical protein
VRRRDKLMPPAPISPVLRDNLDEKERQSG